MYMHSMYENIVRYCAGVLHLVLVLVLTLVPVLLRDELGDAVKSTEVTTCRNFYAF